MKLSERSERHRKLDPDMVGYAVESVKERGGPVTHWEVCLESGAAKHRHYRVEFYMAADGSIAPNGYDGWGTTDIFTEDACELIEDAYASIVDAVTQERSKNMRA